MFGKKGKLYFKLIAAIAIIAAAIYSYSALASDPSAVPVIVNANGTAVSGVPIANAPKEGGAL